MSPDKVHTVAMMANAIQNKPGGEIISDEKAVAWALALYDEAVRQVRASGPTSTEKKCKHGGGTICCDFDCPRHGDG